MENLEERFWSKVLIIPFSECWIWTGSLDHNGYGQFGAKKNRTGAHRAAWQFKFGPIDNGLHVLHRCDNPPCVNTDHLWLGTIADNARDRDSKKRHVNIKKTHCKMGHEFNEKNTKLYIRPRGKERICRACLKNWKRIQTD